MKIKIAIFFLLVTSGVSAQVLVTPSVVNSAGKSYPPFSGIYLTDNIGEVAISTISSASVMVSQGFLQPLVTILGHSLSITKNDVSCKDKKDGNISLAVSNVPQGAQMTYSWNPQNICPGNNCSSIDSLYPGTYSVKVIISYTVGGQAKKDSAVSQNIVISDQNGPCKVKIYNAITPNGDGNNDTWQIDNLSEFPNNQVSIYNRWGQKVFEAKPYKNDWPMQDEAGKLMTTTYFYVLDLGDGAAPIKGWVEVIKN